MSIAVQCTLAELSCMDSHPSSLFSLLISLSGLFDIHSLRLFFSIVLPTISDSCYSGLAIQQLVENIVVLIEYVSLYHLVILTSTVLVPLIVSLLV